MHHAHVKYKEHRMNRYLLDELYGDPRFSYRLEQAAHRERARAIRAGAYWLNGLIAQARARLASLARPGFGRWVERLG